MGARGQYRFSEARQGRKNCLTRKEVPVQSRKKQVGDRTGFEVPSTRNGKTKIN